MPDWLILIHQLPPKPDYVRVKISRRLQRIGAVALKNTVYILPDTGSALEDLAWTAKEIRQRGGEANLCRASFIDGISAGDLEQRFIAAREQDYKPLMTAARKLQRSLGRASKKKSDALAASAADLRKRADAVRAIDHFDAPGGQALAAVLDAIDRRLHRRPESKSTIGNLRGRVWVTRAGIHADRMASAWLIRRFIDPKAAFRFVAGSGYKRRKNELRFDMFEAEFTHEADRCTFEVLLGRAGLNDTALRAIGEVVHDIDLRDGKYGRPETAGVALLINGITIAHQADDGRLRRSGEVFDELYRTYTTVRR